MKSLISLILFVSAIFILESCRKDTVPTENISFYQPTRFPEPHYSFQNNPQSEAKFLLGRDLFYDPILSSDSTISCATCHAQTHAFADHGVALSSGVNGTLGKRNSPSITNMAWMKSFMWDGGVNHLEVFSVAPIINVLEMHETMANVVDKLNHNDYYQAKFLNAFEISVITDQHLLFALTQFMAGIISDQSKYDKYVLGEVELTQEELSGLSLFRQHCATCHHEPLFTDHTYRNNGLDNSFEDDLGRGLITLDTNDNGKFKVPSLRNVSLTYPYMHDGRFYTLDQVLNHYSEGIHSSSPNLDPLLAAPLELSANEKNALKAFLNTLTDYELLDNKKLSEPKR
jgi:cytochrome c peroxidase